MRAAYTELEQLPKPTLVRLMKLGAKVAKCVGDGSQHRH
jgi:hypothetical protein